MLKIGYLGPEGTFCQNAMEKYIGDAKHEPLPFNTVNELINAVEEGELDEAVIPVESSLEGAVTDTLDKLATDARVKVKGEIVIRVSQNLLVKKNTSMEAIKYLISHPQPIGQCRKFISEKLAGVEVKLAKSTAAAAMEVAAGAGDSAAIASENAAKVYGLDILAREIQDTDTSQTRFLAVGRENGPRTGRDKTSIVFSTEDKPGSLYRVLEIFNLWDINMKRIESRPAKNCLGRYIFFVDIEGHIEDEDVRDALKMVRRKTLFMKFLGSYPMHG
jgi:prephenate dehydratase